MRSRFSFLFKGNRLLGWVQQQLTPKQFVIFSSILVGLTAGLAAVLLKEFVHLILQNISVLSRDKQVYIAFFPLIGIALSVLFVKYLNRGKLGKGITNIMHSVARKSSLLPRDQTYSHIVTSGLTVGFGGSVGLESPIVTTGAAIGSNFGRVYKLSYKERTLLLACGAAAGIAGAFNTPIAGVLFALEVLLVEANISAFIPILISAATGALCSKVLLEPDILLHFDLREPFDYFNVPFYLMLGVICGCCSFYYSRVFLVAERYFKKIETRLITKVMVAGVGLYVLVLLFPPLFGEGYLSIKLLSDLQGTELFSKSAFSIDHFTKPLLYLLLLMVVLLKPIATAFTVGGGGNGGNFAPSLFVGAFVGYLFAAIITDLGISDLPISNFTLVAMAGILSGVFHAPLTGIFIIAEVTGGYELIIPLMIVSALSYAVSKYFMPMSIDMTKLAEKEKILVTDTDSYLLSNIDLSLFVESDFSEVNHVSSLRELIEVVAVSKRNVFPVVDAELRLHGLITIDDIRDIMFRQELYDKVSVKELMRRPAYLLNEKDDIRSAMKLFDESHLWNIPVVMEGRYKGFISKSTILEKYREVLIQSSVE